jgi:AraC-like DNA-binding protein
MYRFDQAGRIAQDVRIVHPRGRAAASIDYFWLEEVTSETRDDPWRIVPDGSAHLLYHTLVRDRPDDSNELVLVGARSRYTDVDRSRRAFTIGVRFHPGALRGVANASAAALTDRTVNYRELDSERADVLREALRSARNPGEALHAFCATVEEWCARAQPDPLIREAAAALRVTRQRVRRTGDELGISTRWLRERFHREVGLSPKRFMRVSRLFRALDHALRDRDPNWAAIAAACGHVDQSHLIHEFGDLLGESPDRFLARRDMHRQRRFLQDGATLEG